LSEGCLRPEPDGEDRPRAQSVAQSVKLKATVCQLSFLFQEQR
jgi:hypothetical protein